MKVEGNVKPVTCYLTLFICMRTYLPMGWHLHTSAPSTDNVLRAIRNGIEKYGVPDELYLDNGREYRNKDFSGQTRGHKICEDEQRAEALASRLGIKLHFAIVQRAQSKIIERNFLDVKGRFDKLFNSYKGGNVLEKPEMLKGILKTGNYMEWSEFSGHADDFIRNIFPVIPCQGKNHIGASRADLWNKLIAERAPLRRVSAETASMLTTRTSVGSITRQGFRLKELECWFWAEWMPVNQGKKITLRYDPENLQIAWAYGEDGVLLGEASLWKAQDALVSPDDIIGKVQLSENIARTRKAEKMIREIIPNTTKDEANEMLRGLQAYHGSKEISNPEGGLHITRHDHDAKQLAAEANFGKVDLSQFINQKPADDEEPILIAWPDELPQSQHG